MSNVKPAPQQQETALVLSQQFTGRDPVALLRSRIRDIEGLNTSEVYITLAGGKEIVLQPEEGGSADLPAVLFGTDTQRFLTLARLLGGRRKLNPAMVCAVEMPSANTVSLHLLDGSSVEHSPANFDVYRLIVEAVFGAQAASPLIPYTVPQPSENALATLKRAADWALGKEQAADRDAEAREEAERRRALDRRFGSADAQPRVLMGLP